MASVKFYDRCHAECTRDVVFLLRYRHRKNSEKWHVDSVWLSREEAEAFRKSHSYRWTDSQVYGVPSNGELAELIKST